MADSTEDMMQPEITEETETQEEAEEEEEPEVEDEKEGSDAEAAEEEDNEEEEPQNDESKPEEATKSENGDKEDDKGDTNKDDDEKVEHDPKLSEPDGSDIMKRKCFVGGLAWETTQETCRKYFEKIAPVETMMLLRDRSSGRSRGFGFVTLINKAGAEKVLEKSHRLDGRDLKVNLATPEEKGADAEDDIVPKKCYVGDLSTSTTEG
mmetsp:Transcript_36825/g.53891  ORF Transcript_36825/g.53891 Transcript_36825/m.53891 type:complete len:208 (-) Transcript_36825:103-726(-)